MKVFRRSNLMTVKLGGVEKQRGGGKEPLVCRRNRKKKNEGEEACSIRRRRNCWDCKEDSCGAFRGGPGEKEGERKWGAEILSHWGSVDFSLNGSYRLEWKGVDN